MPAKLKAEIKNLKLIKFKVSFKINKETPADSLKVHYIHKQTVATSIPILITGFY